MTDEKDTRLDYAISLYREDMREKELAELRKYAGTASGMYRPGWRFWNWLFDAEYIAIGPAPITWFVLGGLAVVFMGLLGWVVMSA